MGEKLTKKEKEVLDKIADLEKISVKELAEMNESSYTAERSALESLEGTGPCFGPKLPPQRTVLGYPYVESRNPGACRSGDVIDISPIKPEEMYAFLEKLREEGYLQDVWPEDTVYFFRAMDRGGY